MGGKREEGTGGCAGEGSRRADEDGGRGGRDTGAGRWRREASGMKRAGIGRGQVEEAGGGGRSGALRGGCELVGLEDPFIVDGG